jgi:hypothetical protein
LAMPRLQPIRLRNPPNPCGSPGESQ